MTHIADMDTRRAAQIIAGGGVMSDAAIGLVLASAAIAALIVLTQGGLP